MCELMREIAARVLSSKEPNVLIARWTAVSSDAEISVARLFAVSEALSLLMRIAWVGALK